MIPSDSDNEQFQHYVNRPEIRHLRISHEAGHAVLAEHFGYELRNVITEASMVSTDGATGGSTEIDWGKLETRSDFG
jgi:hypothetical protein